MTYKVKGKEDEEGDGKAVANVESEFFIHAGYAGGGDLALRS